MFTDRKIIKFVLLLCSNWALAQADLQLCKTEFSANCIQ